jgi:hypothetical protein
MSVNHVRRHRTHEADTADLGRKRTERVCALLNLTDHLAAAHAAYEAHEVDGALEMFQQMLEVERMIRMFAPRIYAERWTEWVQRDMQLAHAADEPHPRCSICNMAEAGPLRPASGSCR